MTDNGAAMLARGNDGRPELPSEAIYVPPKTENFCWRIEHAQIREDGFAMVHGDPDSGKSIVLRLLAERLKRLPDITVGAINHPQSNMADFYRELGDIFGVPLRPSNRWGGFKALRERWLATEFASREELLACLDHLSSGAGNASLMTPQLRQTLCDHAAGNYRILTTLAAELLAAAAQRELPVLDEKLYLDVFAQPESAAPRRTAR
ncbi:MAG: hypothetical protein V7642_391 [Burkholderiales bacterium]|jgi:general secretion pathway protein A